MSADQIENIYELSPMQQGMLFHSTTVPGSGVYVEQVSCVLHGALDIAAFERAWQEIVARHPILRTAFYWENLEKPLQVVYRSVPVRVERQDWRDLSPEEQASSLAAYLASERQRGFELSQPPLLRLTLARIADDAYRFVWSHHHILLDGWSLPPLLTEVLRCYEAFHDGRAPSMERSRPYGDYIAWLQQQDTLRAEQFWRQALQGFTTPPTLGANGRHAHQAHQTTIAAEHDLTLSADATALLQAFARQHGLTLNTLVQAAWALVLSQYSGAADVLFGATVSGRPGELAGVEQMVGLFINTLPVRVQVAPDAEVLPWLQQLQAQQTLLWQYQYLPLVEIQRCADVPPGQPLFESILVFENYPLTDLSDSWSGSVRLEDVQFYEQTNYPLTVAAFPGAELGLRISYDCQRFAADEAARYLEHLHTLLLALAANPYGRLADLPLLTPAEQHLLALWNATGAPRVPVTIHELIEEQVARTPDAVALAVVDAAGDSVAQVTYRELDERANQLAHELRTLGVGPESRVGLCLHRSIELLVGLLGILKAGGCYVPLDPSYPQERLSLMIEDAQMPVILTQERLAAELATTQGRLLRLDTDWPAIARHPVEKPDVPVCADHLVYVIYTSGSTGRPKGVLIEHRSLVNHTQTMTQRFGCMPNDRLLQFSSLSFDGAVDSVFPVLLLGATIVMPSTTAISNADLVRLCERQAITLLVMPAAFWQQWAVDMHPGPQPMMPALRLVLVGGDSPDQASIRSWHRVVGRDLPVFNAYGPTEATVAATLYQTTCAQAARLRSARLPIGVPLPNVQVYLLDAQLRQVPIGATGEVYIGGAGVARGYLNRPDLTAERFVPDPFAQQPGARFYRTGDLARYHADGNLEFLGRGDRQVKLRGFRIELGEIEAALRQHPAVRQCVVLAREDRNGDRRLVAYVVEQQNKGTREQNEEQGTGAVRVPCGCPLGMGTRHGHPAHKEPGALWAHQEAETRNLELGTWNLGLREFLGARLPAYMVPSAFVVLDALPLSPNGKLDLRALPLPDSGGSDLVGGAVGPRTYVTDMLLTIWSSVLGRDRIGLHDNFFELGGHSLLATRVVSQVRSIFQVELSLLSVFEAPTIAALAQQIEAALQTSQSLALPPIGATGADRAPLSFTQERLWSFDRRDPGNPAFNIPTAVRLRGAVDIAALERSLNKLVRRHGALRTTIAELDGQTIQIVAPELTLHVPVVDLAELPPHEREAEVRRLIDEDGLRRFDLTRGPLLRCTVLRVAPAEHVLLLTLHHMVSDGWSVSVFVRELATFYAADVAQDAAALPDLPIQYVDYAIWQRRWLDPGAPGDVLDRLLSHWKQQLADVPHVLHLPTDFPRPAVRTFRGGQESLRLPETLSGQIRDLSRSEGATLFMTLLAAFNIGLWRVTGQSDMVIGSPSAGRVLAETEHLIGLFINTLPLRLRLDADLTFQDLLGRVRSTTLAAYAHQYLPLGVLLQALDLPHDPRYTPLFQVVFNMLNVPDVRAELSRLTIEAVPPPNIGSKFDFTLYVQEAEGSIQLDLVYNADLFSAARMRHLLTQFQRLLVQVVAEPAQPIAGFGWEAYAA
ncbi:MAG TPA: amino acid adenylation domain-containing protein [Herpetosiphonaceae bacterium]